MDYGAAYGQVDQLLHKEGNKGEYGHIKTKRYFLSPDINRCFRKL